MSRTFLNNIDLAKNELQNARIQNLGSAPGSPVSGQIYYDTATGTLQLRNASAFFAVLDSGAVAQSKTGSLTLTGGLIVNTTGITGNQTIVLSGTGASSVAGNFTAVVHVSSGLTGATSASRYVGATASGAPGSGTFSTGDFIVDQAGTVRVCTAGGSPGTWVAVAQYLLGQTNTWTAAQTFNAAITGNNTINLTGTGTHSVGGTFTATALIASGLTGAVAASRYVGATSGAAPSTGTFNTGDFAIGQTGSVFICSAGGSPGTWVTLTSAGTIYNQSIKANGGGAITQRATMNFINGTYTTATAVDNASQSDIKFDVNVAALHLNDLATATGNYAMGSNKLTGLADGTAATDSATWGQVQNLVSGLDWKQSVRVVATSNGTLASAFENGDTVDGVALATGNRILLAGQSSAAENGIYTVNASGAPTRATDADASGEISVGTVVPVEAGTAGANTFYYCTATNATPWVPGTNTSTWSYLFTVSATQAGAGLTASGNVLAVGAGTGITVNADDVAVNHAVVPYLYSTTIGDNSSTSLVVTHNLGTRSVIVRVFTTASTYDEVECDIQHTSTTTVTCIFAVAPTTAQYTVVVLG